MSVYLVLVFSCHCLFSHSFFNSLIVLPRTCIITFLLFFSHQVMPISSRPHGLQQARLCPAPSPRVGPSSCPWHWWCHPTISSSNTLFSFCLQSFPASGSFQMSWLCASGGQSIGASASASVLPMSIQGWLSLRLTGLISLLSRGLSSVFSSTLPSLRSSFHSHVWLLERP